jgi:hypothetical protein
MNLQRFSAKAGAVDFGRAGKTALAVGVGALLLSGTAGAVTIPWVGTADYTQAPTTGGDEDTVGPFDEYDFANGVSLLQGTFVQTPGSFTVGDTFVGYYQSYLTQHALNGIEVSAPNLVGDGASTGYEVTVTGTYTTQITSVDGGGNGIFSVTGGNFDVWFDTTADYSFLGDSGFTNGDSLISGTISGGSGSFLPAFGVGFSDVDLIIGAFSYDQNVYEPDTIVGGDSIFTLKLNNTGTGPTAGVTGVLGNAVGTGDILMEADGNLKLEAVPVPPAVWLFGSGLLGLVGVARRRRS